MYFMFYSYPKKGIGLKLFEDEKELRILPFDPHNLNDLRFLSQQNHFGQAVEQTGADVLGVREQFEKWKLLYKEANLASRKKRKSDFGVSIVEKCKKRLKIYRAMVQTNKAALNHRSSSVVEAARNLDSLFRANKKILTTAMTVNTTSIDNILSSLTKEYAGHVSAAGIGDWVEYLADTNDECRDLFNLRDDEYTAQADLNMRNSRKKLTEQYQLICRIVNVFADINGEELYADFINLLNVINDECRVELSKQKGVRKARLEREKKAANSILTEKKENTI
jgi:hypothetical protein